MNASRDAFGRLLVEVEELDVAGRTDVLRRLSGSLQASTSRETAWLGRAILLWLQQGGDLAAALGVRPPRGSRRTAQSLVLQVQRDQTLLRLSNAAGGDAQAIRLLRGQVQRPPALQDLVLEAQRLRCPCSRAAFARARQRASHHRG